MASLYIRARVLPDGSKRYDVKYRRGGRYFPLEHAGTFRTTREADERKRLVGDLLAGGINPRVEFARSLKPDRPFHEIADHWLGTRLAVADTTRAGYEQRMPLILRAFGDVPLAELDRDRITAWISSLAQRYKPGTVRLYVAQIRMLLDFADVEPNPARDRRIQLPRFTRAEPQPPGAEAVADAVAAVSDLYRLPLLVMEQAGTRISETLSLATDDVDVGSIRIRREHSKTGKGRLVHVPGLITDALNERLPFQPNRNSVGTALRRTGQGFHPHDLRHRRATLWHQAGVPAVELARRLGHARPSMSLDVYANVRPLRELDAHTLAELLR